MLRGRLWRGAVVAGRGGRVDTGEGARNGVLQRGVRWESCGGLQGLGGVG
ncbi:MAG: hypothetical protein RMM10_12885 [Anaerolineae bacterium]|nr:hypothetical protein [Thermoflexus sp.]MCS7352378.1 hypothetical protein [Thermoflexus sp.]MDW8181844.1 hypothetical protein [Anaerolineae bacterium]